MERQFLTIVSLILISSCQLDQAISVDDLSNESVAIYADDEIVINEIEVDDFVAKMRQKKKNFARATVYRTIKQLFDACHIL